MLSSDVAVQVFEACREELVDAQVRVRHAVTGRELVCLGDVVDEMRDIGTDGEAAGATGVLRGLVREFGRVRVAPGDRIEVYIGGEWIGKRVRGDPRFVGAELVEFAYGPEATHD